MAQDMANLGESPWALEKQVFLLGGVFCRRPAALPGPAAAVWGLALAEGGDHVLS